MRYRSAWQIRAPLIGLTGLVAAVIAWRAAPVGATVGITGPDNFSAVALSDSDGNYQFSNLPEGVYHVSVGHEIFWGQTSFTVTVTTGQ